MPDESANPLLVGWLKEWMDVAHERNSKGYQTYKKAYQSMKATPLTFSHPSEAVILNGLGDKLCARLTTELENYCTEKGLPMPQKTKKKKRPSTVDATGEEEEEEERPPKKARKIQPYVPKLKSGPYALLLALGTLNRETGQALSKTDLIELAQPNCDSSFTAPSDPTKFFTAWNSMKTLESKEFVCTKGHPTKRYYLSDDGWEVAIRIKEHGEGTVASPNKKSKSKKQTTPEPPVVAGPSKCSKSAPTFTSIPDEVFDLCSSPESRSKAKSPMNKPAKASTFSPVKALRATYDTIVLPPGSFDVRLVLDSREVRTTTDRGYAEKELKKLSVTPIVRSLPLGDMVWIAQVKPEFAGSLQQLNTGDEEEGNTEIVLEHIVERKRLDDFIISIKDGRFNEQKFRLKKSGIKNPVYVIEEYSISAQHADKYGEGMETAIKQLQVVYDVFVQPTTKLDDTLRYLARMTRQLQAKYQNKELHVMKSNRLESENHLKLLSDLRAKSPEATFGFTFSAFSAMCDKNDSMTLRDVYLRMLLCVRGVTADKAIEISKIWKTPLELIEAYERQPDQKGRENMISERLGNVIPRKKVGKVLSAKVAEIWAS